LYSPLGLAYGTLYSAILLTRPARVVIVTSPQAIKHLHDALDAARFYHSKFSHEAHVLEDPLGGFDEARKLARQLAKNPGARNIINLTGGTTVLQECVRSVGDILRRGDAHAEALAEAGVPSLAPEDFAGGAPFRAAVAHTSRAARESQHLRVREVAVVDRRPAPEQARNPLTVGELVEVSPL
jgi:hypothetical protein